MPAQTVKIENLAQYGFYPDAKPQNLPANAFSYTRNWRFPEGNYAEVTPGYSDAFFYRSKNDFGNADTRITFMHTWALPDKNALSYYDSIGKTMWFIENDPYTDGVLELKMSQSSHESGYFTVIASGTPAAGEVIRNSNTQFQLGFSDSDAAQEWITAGVAGATLRIVDSEVTFAKSIFTLPTRSGSVITFSSINNLPAMDSDDNLLFYIGTDFQHANNVEHAWQATEAFGVPIYNNGEEAPWEFVDETSPYIKRLTNWPTGAKAKTITSFNAFLFALGYENSSAAVGSRGSSRTIAISDVITVPGTLPAWDFDSDTSYAQIFDLSLYTEGSLLTAHEFNNTLYIFTTSDIIAMNYDGEGAFSATVLPTGGGAMSPRSVTPIPNGFFVIGNGRMYTFDGSSYTPVGEGHWTQTWFDFRNDDRLDEIQAVYDDRSRSVWIKTPVSTSSQEMWIYNLDTGSIAVLDDHQEIGYLLHSGTGLPNFNLTWDRFLSDLEWDNIPQNSWNAFPGSAEGSYQNRLVSCGNRKFFVHDQGADFNGRTINAVLRKDGAKGGVSSHESFTISRVIPWLEAESGTMTSVRVGGMTTADKPVTWTPYRTWTSGTSEKLDFRKSVKWGSIEFLSQTSGVQLSGFEIDVVPQNRR